MMRSRTPSWPIRCAAVSRSSNSPALVKEPGEENRFRDRRDRRPGTVFTHLHDRPVSHAGENHVTKPQLLIMVRVPTVEYHVTTFCARHWVREDQLESVIGCPVTLFTELDLLASPAERKLR